MADTTNAITTTIDKTVDAMTAPATAAIDAVVKVEKTATRSIARKGRKSATKRRAPAKIAATVQKINRRNVKSTKRAARATVAAATTQIERNAPMAYDFSKMFAGFELPAADRFQGLFNGAGERGQDLVRKSQEAASEMTEFAKANLEALTEAGRIAATGVRSLGQDALASSRDGFEQASVSLKTLADAKSPTEFFQLQSELARTSFDRVVAEGSKFAEAMVKLAGEAVQPLSNRATVNAERINELAA